MRGFEGVLGYTCAINVSKLLILLVSPMGSSPSLTSSQLFSRNQRSALLEEILK